MRADRRCFIQRGSLLLGAAASGLPLHSVSAAPPPGAAGHSGLHPEAVAFLRSCRVREMYLTGGSALGARKSPHSVRLLAVTASPRTVFTVAAASVSVSAGTGQAIRELHAQGNTAAFFLGDTHYTLECLTSAGLSSRRAALSAGRGIRFAHEAVLRRLDSGALAFDPWGVLRTGGGTLRFTGNPAASGPADRFTAYMQGSIEALLYGLTVSRDFTAFGKALLASPPVDDSQAADIANETAAGVTLLARYAGSPAVTALLQSPLVSASLHRTFGVTGSQACIAARRTGAPLTSGAPWLHGMLGPERLAVRKGRVWIAESDRFTFLQSNAALDGARALSGAAF